MRSFAVEDHASEPAYWLTSLEAAVEHVIALDADDDGARGGAEAARARGGEETKEERGGDGAAARPRSDDDDGSDRDSDDDDDDDGGASGDDSDDDALVPAWEMSMRELGEWLADVVLVSDTVSLLQKTGILT